MSNRKYPTRCCPRAPVNIEGTGLHCSFCGAHLCHEHEVDAEVQGHIFTACRHCAETLRSRRPGKHEECTCHHEDYCDLHTEIEGIG